MEKLPNTNEGSFAAICSNAVAQQVLENNHTTTINIYKLNYAAVIFTLTCFSVTMMVISYLLRGKSVRGLKSPAMVIYYLAKTAYKPEHAELCKTLIEKEDYDVNYIHSEVQLSLFLCACLSGNAELVTFMLARGANIHDVSSHGDSVFYLVASGMNLETSDFKTLDFLLLSGCDVNSQNYSGFTALHLACLRGNLSLVKYLLQNGADPTIATYESVLPHELALSEGHADIAEYLLNVPRKIEHW